MSVTVRPCRADDRAACAQVFFRAVREGAAGHYTAAQRAVWATTPEPDHSTESKLLSQWCFVAERDGRVTGFLSMRPDGYLDMAFVLPEEMGRGTAGLIHERVLERARAAGLSGLTVHASIYSRQFLARRGWQVDEVEDFESGGQHCERFCMSVVVAPPEVRDRGA